MKRFSTTLSIILIACMAISAETLPANAALIAEAGTYGIYIVEEKPAVDDFTPAVVSLWTRSNADNTARRVLTTNPNGVPFDQYSFSSGEAKVMGENAVITVEGVTVNPYDEAIWVISGTVDMRNVYTFIVNVNSGTIIHLPSNSVCLGFTSEDGDIVVESYDYYDGGGRYSVIEAFDMNGHRMGKMKLQHEH